MTNDVNTNGYQSWQIFVANFIEHIGKYHSCNINQVRAIAAAAAASSGEGNIESFIQSTQWWKTLIEKFPQISDFVVMDDIQNKLKKVPSTKDYLEPFMTLMNKFNYHKCPEYIWSCEEITVNVKKGSKKETFIYPARIRSGTNASTTKNSLSVLCSISPVGKSTPPYFVMRDTEEIEDMGTILYSKNEKGAVSKGTLVDWFKTIFLKECPKKRSKAKPVVLLIDSQIFNVSTELMEIALNENVLLLPLVPHIPVACQPFDLVLFSNIRPEIESDCSTKNGSSSFEETMTLVKMAMEKHLTSDVARRGFTKCGIYPCDLGAFVQCNKARVGN